MDRIVELIIIFYFISVFLRFLKKGQKGKDKSYPFPHPRPAPPPQPPPTRREEQVPLPSSRRAPQQAPTPSSRRAPQQAPRTVYTSKDRDALDILAEWERRARGQRAGTQREGAAGPEVSSGKRVEAPARRKLEVSTMKGPVKRPSMKTAPREMRRPVQPGMPKMEEELKLPSPEEPEGIPVEEIAEGEILFLSSPAMLWQGIVMSEILRAPLSRRDPFLLPYLRG